jgi:hypothetical protein
MPITNRSAPGFAASQPEVNRLAAPEIGLVAAICRMKLECHKRRLTGRLPRRIEAARIYGVQSDSVTKPSVEGGRSMEASAAANGGRRASGV